MSQLVQSPGVSQKMKTKAAVHKIKFGSPNLQQVLRQRCRERLREKRRELFNSKRFGVCTADNGEIQDTLTQIVRKEFSDLTIMNIDESTDSGGFDTEPLTDEEAFEIEKEILAEEEQWILDEYERLEEEDSQMLNLYADDYMKNEIVCPICEKSAIFETSNGLSCSGCNLSLPPRMGLCQFRVALDENLSNHALGCRDQPCFMTVPENDTILLCLSCETCSSFSIIM